MFSTNAGAVYLFSGGLAYLIGTILVTIALIGTQNNALAALDEAGTVGAGHRTAWNQVRHRLRSRSCIAGQDVTKQNLMGKKTELPLGLLTYG